MAFSSSFHLFSRCTGPYITNLRAKDPYCKGIHNCWSKGETPFQKGENHETMTKRYNLCLKNIFKKPCSDLAKIYTRACICSEDSKLFKPWPKPILWPQAKFKVQHIIDWYSTDSGAPEGVQHGIIYGNV